MIIHIVTQLFDVLGKFGQRSAKVSINTSYRNTMLKKILILSFFSLAFAQISYAANTTRDPLNLSGTYKCHGYDMHDGGYEDATAILTTDKKDSAFANNYGAYHFKLLEKSGTIYRGEAAASGNTLAIYFANTSEPKSNDYGVGIATVTHDKDIKGNATTVLHKFYYEPHYQGGSNGSETCVKEN